tara:strand:+ start:386 stop:586 length:201 start_codon:yes stop_codon:yes gene_type:complete
MRETYSLTININKMTAVIITIQGEVRKQINLLESLKEMPKQHKGAIKDLKKSIEQHKEAIKLLNSN